MSEFTPTKAPDTSTTGRHLPALDGLRGCAILAVIICHVSGTFGASQTLTGRFAAAGWVGVDLFFVLSGFLLTGILHDTQHSSRYFRNFYARRTLRTFPLYYGFLFATLIVYMLLGFHWRPRVLLYLGYLQNLAPGALLFNPTPVTDAATTPLELFWSLAVEEHFYLFWPLAVRFLRTPRRIFAGAAGLAMFSLSLRILAHLTGLAQTYPLFGYMCTPARLDSLAIGAMLAAAVRTRYRGRTVAAAPAVFVVLAGVVVWYTARYSLDEFFDVRVATVGFSVLGILFAALLATSLRKGGVTERLFSLSPLRLCGMLSYGMYVYHTVVNRLTDWYVSPLLIGLLHSHRGARDAGVLLGFAGTVAVSWMSFRWFEQPVLRLKRHFQDDSPWPKLRRQLQSPVVDEPAS